MGKTVAAGLLPLGALLMFAVPAQAAPAPGNESGTGNAVATINQLRAQGADVRISRIGNAPLDECEVTSVRNISQPAQIIPIDDEDITVFTTFPKRKVTVTLNCSH
jgi:hypothetical protein